MRLSPTGCIVFVLYSIILPLVFDLDRGLPLSHEVLCKSSFLNTSYNKVTVIGTAASRVYFHLKAEAVRMGE